MSRWRERQKAVPVLGPLLRRVWQRVRPRSRAERIDRRDDELMGRVLDRVRGPDANVADVGTNVGSFLAVVLRRAPRGRHTACEPLPHLAAVLRERSPGVWVHAGAVGERAGEVEFTHVVGNNAFSGLKRRIALAPGQAVEVLRVPVARLDDLIPAGEPVALVKIDVEGAELEVLRGALGLLARCRPWVLLEHGLCGLATYGTRSREVFDLFARVGFGVWRLDHWLDARPPLSADEFDAVMRGGNSWNFLAGPAPVDRLDPAGRPAGDPRRAARRTAPLTPSV